MAIQLQRDSLGRITSLTDPAGKSLLYSYSASGDLTEYIDASGAVTRLFYDYQHLLIRMEDPLGHTMIRNEFDSAGRRTATEDAEGNRTTFTYDLIAGTVTTTNPDGTQVMVQYNPDGNVIKNSTMVTIDGVPTVVENNFEYDADGNETAVVDADGLRVERSFDGPRVTQSVVDPSGLALTTNTLYDSAGDLLETTDPYGYRRIFDNDSKGNPVAVDGPGAVDQGFVYDTSGRLTEMADPLGDRTELTYDSTGRVIARERFSLAGDLLARTELDYDLTGNLLENRLIEVGSANPPKVISFAYDDSNRLISRVDPEGNIRSWEYDARGKLTASVDALGRRTIYTYNPNGFLLKTTLASGGVITNEYDALGNVIKSTDPDGLVREVLYDELGRQVATSINGAVLERRVFSAAGRLIAVIGPGGERTDYQRDTAGRITQIQLPEVIDGRSGLMVRPTVNKLLDAVGRPLEITDPNGDQVIFQYDTNGRLSSRQAADGTTISQVVDASGRLASVTNEMGQTIDYRYDAMGRIVQVIQPAPEPGDPRPVTSYTYDSLGNLRTTLDTLGRATLFDYDNAGRLALKQRPDGNSTAMTYNVVGQLARVTESEGTTTDFIYDFNGRLTQRSSSTGELELISYNYNGDRLTTTDAQGTSQYSYYANGLLKSITDPDSGLIQYNYDANQRVSQMTADGDLVTYSYDANSRLATVTSQLGLTSYAYDPSGRPVRKLLPNGVKVDTAYNKRGRITELSHTDTNDFVLETFSASYRPDGRRSSLSELNGSQETYQYDNLGRMVSVERTGLQAYQHDYDYDTAGNKISETINGIEILSGFDSNNRLLYRGADTYTYDQRGNRIASTVNGETLAYQWDAFNRMTEIAYPGGAVNYAYDVDGQRVSENINGVETRFIHDQRNPSGYSQVVKELDSLGQGIASYTYGLQILGQSRGAINNFYSEDPHGSIRMLTNAAGVITDTYNYLPYGKMNSHSGTTENAYAYSSERLDAITGNYNLRARQYDPDSGGFISRDYYQGNLMNPGSMHSYLYAGADPINFADPLGLFSLTENIVVQSISSGIQKAWNSLKAIRGYCKAKGVARVVNAISAASQIAVAGFGLLAQIKKTPNNVEGTFFDKLNVEFPLGDENTLGLEINPNLQEKSLAIKLAVSDGGMSRDSASVSIEASPSGLKASGGIGRDLDLVEFQACGVTFATISVGVELTGGAGASKWEVVGEGSASASLKLGFGIGVSDGDPNVVQDDFGAANQFNVGELSWKAIELKYNSSKKQSVSGYAFGFTIPVN